MPFGCAPTAGTGAPSSPSGRGGKGDSDDDFRPRHQGVRLSPAALSDMESASPVGAAPANIAGGAGAWCWGALSFESHLTEAAHMTAQRLCCNTLRPMRANTLRLFG